MHPTMIAEMLVTARQQDQQNRARTHRAGRRDASERRHHLLGRRHDGRR